MLRPAAGVFREELPADSIQGPFDRIQGSFDRIQGSFDRIQGSFDRIQGSFDRIQGSFDRIQGSFHTSGCDVGVFVENDVEYKALLIKYRALSPGVFL